MTMIDGNWDGNNLIKLASKKMGDILSFPTPTIGSHQVMNFETVIRLYTDIG